MYNKDKTDNAMTENLDFRSLCFCASKVNILTNLPHPIFLLFLPNGDRRSSEGRVEEYQRGPLLENIRAVLVYVLSNDDKNDDDKKDDDKKDDDKKYHIKEND